MTDIQEKKELRKKIDRRRGVLSWGIQSMVWALVCWAALITGDIDHFEWAVVLMSALLTGFSAITLSIAAFPQVD